MSGLTSWKGWVLAGLAILMLGTAMGQRSKQELQRAFRETTQAARELRQSGEMTPEAIKELIDEYDKMLVEADDMPSNFRQQVLTGKVTCTQALGDLAASVAILQELIEGYPESRQTDFREKRLKDILAKMKSESQKESMAKQLSDMPERLKEIISKLSNLAKSRSTDPKEYGKILEQLEEYYPEIDPGNIAVRAMVLATKGGIYENFLKENDAAIREYQRIVDEFPGTEFANRTETKITKMKVLGSLVTGAEFPGFTFENLQGENVSLEDYRGKVVLLDFWATWCQPCVQELPNVQDAYNAFHEDGFEIIGISLDQEKDKLLNFIQQNDMNWPQFFDGKGWQNRLAEQYGISRIPATYLIGKDGKISSRNLRGQILLLSVAKLLFKEVESLPESSLMDLNKVAFNPDDFEFNELPMYGDEKLSWKQKRLNKQYVDDMIRHTGSREKAVHYATSAGWESYYLGDPETAVKRFNQACLIDANSRNALWGFAVISLKRGNIDDALNYYIMAIENGEPNPSLEWEYKYALRLKRINQDSN